MTTVELPAAVLGGGAEQPSSRTLSTQKDRRKNFMKTKCARKLLKSSSANGSTGANQALQNRRRGFLYAVLYRTGRPHYVPDNRLNVGV